MTKHSDFIKQGNEVCYYGRKVVIDEILDYTFEEIPTEGELNETPNLYFAGIKDYKNTLGVEREYLSDVCDAYLEAIDNNDSYEWLTKDTPKNFTEYCTDYCCI